MGRTMRNPTAPQPCGRPFPRLSRRAGTGTRQCCFAARHRVHRPHHAIRCLGPSRGSRRPVTLDSFQLNGKDYHVQTGSVERFSAAHKKIWALSVEAPAWEPPLVPSPAGEGRIDRRRGGAAGRRHGRSRRHWQTRGRPRRRNRVNFPVPDNSRVVERSNGLSGPLRLAIPLGED